MRGTPPGPRPTPHRSEVAWSLPLVEAPPEVLGRDPGALHGRSAPGDGPANSIAVHAGDLVLLRVAVTAVQLDGEVGDLLDHLVGEALGDGRVELFGCARSGSVRGSVDQESCGVDLDHHVGQ